MKISRYMLSEDDKKRIHHRIRRIIGQAEAVDRMVQEEAPCVDVVMQISAASGALSKVAQLVLQDHLAGSLSDAASSEDAAQREAILQELIVLFDKYASTK
ncbi:MULTISPECIES: metal-sensitive transcriptional regulator [Rhodopirellula]|nr:metal-sensitive transcriptional regulator [Rhodopirellula europaea]